MTEIKDVIKHYRKLLGMSQEELGHKVGVSTSTIGMYEQGRRKPSFEVERLSQTLSIFDLIRYGAKMISRPWRVRRDG